MEKRDLGIYIHIPFCVKKCDYCDFPSAARTPQEMAWYMRNLMKEIRSYEALGSLYRVDTIFFGGGTPSILPPIQIMRVLMQLREEFEVAEDAEITIECNPGTLTRENLLSYRDLGINRLSLGVQSANDAELKLLERIHSWQEVPDNVRLARKLGFKNINLDVMSGLPHQSVKSYRDTLQRIVELRPEHISSYSLILEEGTPFYDRYRTGEGQKVLPGEDAEREMYYETRDFLKTHGYHRYEISNYSLEGRECRHNSRYWTGGEYLGVGLSAASYLDGKRFANTSDWISYGEEVRHAYQRYKAAPAQSRKDAMEEFMFLGLRMTCGIRTSEFCQRFGTDYYEVYGDVTERLEGQKLLTVQNGRVRLTDYGIDVSNRVLAEFLLEEGDV